MIRFPNRRTNSFCKFFILIQFFSLTTYRQLQNQKDVKKIIYQKYIDISLCRWLFSDFSTLQCLLPCVDCNYRKKLNNPFFKSENYLYFWCLTQIVLFTEYIYCINSIPELQIMKVIKIYLFYVMSFIWALYCKVI